MASARIASARITGILSSMMFSQCTLGLKPAMLKLARSVQIIYMWKHSTHLLLTQILMILGGCVPLEIGNGQVIEKEETSNFMVEFGGVRD
jgi:hypothetical protein